MGAIIPQVVSEDRAGGAQIIDGGLRFDGAKSQYLKRTFSAGNTRTFTFSAWVKRLNTTDGIIFSAQSGNTSYRDMLLFTNDKLNFICTNSSNVTTANIQTTALYRDPSAWYHITLAIDTTQATDANKIKIYVNGTQVTSFSYTVYPSQNTDFSFDGATLHTIGQAASGTAYNFSGQISNVYFIDGQALDPSYFGFTDPLTNTWRPKKLSSSVAFGTNGFYLPFDGSAPIGQDQSGRGNNWTPVNFGGSAALDKATGALPILNTTPSGKTATVGVRTDSNASSLVLALPLVGIKSDFSNTINSGTSNKTITNTSVTFSSSASNFYGGSAKFASAYLSTNSSADFNFGSGNFTVECWVYLLSQGSGGYNHYFSVSTQDTFALKSWSSYFYLYANSGTAVPSSNAPPLNKWTHLALVRNGSTLTIYVDGIASGSSSTSASFGTTAAATIGTAGGTSGEYLDGYMQDLRVYKGLAKYTSNFIPASTDPDIVPDSPSGVSYSSNVALVPSTDGAVAFDGSSGYLSLADSADFAFGSGDFTIEFFLYLPNSSSVFRYGQGEGGSPAFVQDISATSIGFAIGPSIWTINTGITTPLPVSSWLHYAFVRSGNNLLFFINGDLRGTYAYSSTWPDSSSTLTIGQQRGAYGTALISNFHVVKGTALYTANFTPPTAPISSVANTKLLCCKSNSSATTADVTPGTKIGRAHV